jgi:hypothetical protein
MGQQATRAPIDQQMRRLDLSSEGCLDAPTKEFGNICKGCAIAERTCRSVLHLYSGASPFGQVVHITDIGKDVLYKPANDAV